MTSNQFGGNIRLKTTWKPNVKEFGEQIANLPQTQKKLLAVANSVAASAKLTLQSNETAAAPDVPNLPPVGLAKGPRKWSARATQVAAMVKVKDATILGKFKNAGGRTVIGVTRVALVISDHPYSTLWERGFEGIPNTKYMTKAVLHGANAFSGIRKRSPK